ncbi:MAG: hypothetical protein JWN04_4317 [Myxococcaceae bacterium]|nr:hypothetical protein [Myxococcaceae bacterium]
MGKSYLFVGMSAVVTVVGCGDDSGSKQATSASTSALCEQLCERASAKHCGSETQADCETSCKDQAASIPSACVSERDKFLQCGAKASFQCDAQTHEADAIDCLNQLNELTACAEAHADDGPAAGAGSTPSAHLDAGTVSGSGAGPELGRDAGTQLGSDAGAHLGRDAGAPAHTDGGLASVVCSPAPDDDACTTCIHSKCCDALTACAADAGCAAIGECVSACADGDDACLQACGDQASSAALDAFNASLECSQTACPSECGGPSEPSHNGGSDSCLPTAVPPGYCTAAERPVARECTSKPEGDCVLLPNVADVYCCAQ